MKGTMNDKEMRELDMWIRKAIPELNYSLFRPTVNSADAMDVLKKCHDKLDCEDIVMGRCDSMVQWCGGDWYLYSIFRENRSAIRRRVNGETLELAICRFAKELFSR